MADANNSAGIDVSVVIGCHHCGSTLHDSLDSIAAQGDIPTWECLIVANGPFQLDATLRQRLERDPRFRLIHSGEPGLTRALRLGCAQARGALIARLDAGDAMAPDRLRRQAEVFVRHPTVVLATSAVQVCAPQWEPIWVERAEVPPDQPLRTDTLPPEKGIRFNIPHHASVMFRRDAYERAGGYRPEFYFGQDWDLWFRLAREGEMYLDSKMLTRVRLQPDGLSSRHRREQVRIAQISLACYGARCRGESETDLLERAAQIRPLTSQRRRFRLPWSGRLAEGYYFIAEGLRRNGDPRCHHYFRGAIRQGFWQPRIWIRALQSLWLPSGGSATGPS